MAESFPALPTGATPTSELVIIIRTGIQAFRAAGIALAIVRDDPARWAPHPSFTAWLDAEFGELLSVPRAWQLTTAARMADDLQAAWPGAPALPESHYRTMARLLPPGPDRGALAAQVVQELDTPGGKITEARLVKAITGLPQHKAAKLDPEPKSADVLALAEVGAAVTAAANAAALLDKVTTTQATKVWREQLGVALAELVVRVNMLGAMTEVLLAKPFPPLWTPGAVATEDNVAPTVVDGWVDPPDAAPAPYGITAWTTGQVVMAVLLALDPGQALTVGEVATAAELRAPTLHSAGAYRQALHTLRHRGEVAQVGETDKGHPLYAAANDDGQ